MQESIEKIYDITTDLYSAENYLRVAADQEELEGIKSKFSTIEAGLKQKSEEVADKSSEKEAIDYVRALIASSPTLWGDAKKRLDFLNPLAGKAKEVMGEYTLLAKDVGSELPLKIAEGTP